MIKELTVYTVVCDRCAKDINEGEDYTCWNDKEYAQECALEARWIKEDDRHYCPDCYTHDDDDNIVIKRK